VLLSSLIAVKSTLMELILRSAIHRRSREAEGDPSDHAAPTGLGNVVGGELVSRTLVLTPPSMARTDQVNPGDCNVQSVVGKSSTSLARAVVVHSSSDRLEPEVDTGGETAADEAVKQNGKFTSAAFEGNLGRRSIGLRFEAGEKLDRLDRAERQIFAARIMGPGKSRQ
jgi:hypothetical protein